nr:hypothetical protein [uncultured Flavobacterium sp.]
MNLSKSKSIILIILLILSSVGVVKGQDIKLKNDKIFLENNYILNYKKSDFGGKFQVYTIDQNEEILFINLQEVPDKFKSYWKFYFPKQNKYFYKGIIDSFKKELKLLFEDKVIDKDGKVNESNLDSYITKYNEL